MGGIVSTGHNNDDLIDNLLEVEYIKTSIIERVFRAVDRAEYFLPESRGNAYKDVAWKCGNLHLSAPCIYSEVMEGLCLGQGLSFLNLGSGTGYLSTMIGLILGKNGINHGIEIYEDVVQYANKKLEEFKKYSGAMDEYDFCEPTFIKGNCLCLSESRLYDRVYCGASCPPAFEPYMKSLLKIGGILVVPINEHLIQFKRISETDWSSKTLLPVSFASLIQPSDDSQEIVIPIEIQPKSLQAVTRSIIRNILRKNIEIELPPPPKKSVHKKKPRKKRILRRFIVPLFEDDSSEEEQQQPGLMFSARNGVRGRADMYNDYENFFSHVIDTIRFRTGTGPNQQKSTEMQTEEHEVNHNENDAAIEEDNETDAGVAMEVNLEKDDNDITTSTSVIEESCCSGLDNKETSEATPAEQFRRGAGERKKFDSGLGDENEILNVSEDNGNEPDDSSSSNSDEDDKLKRAKRSSKPENLSRPKWRRIALEPSFSSSSSDTEEEYENTLQINNNELRMYQSPYTILIKDKIQKLPLPQILKNYLNFYREF